MSVKKRRVLLVDDDQDYLFQQKFFLEEEGIEVFFAHTRKEANVHIEKNSFDLAIVDLMMEEMDSGAVLAHSIKKMNPSIPVVMVTGVNSQTGISFDLHSKGRKDWLKADLLLTKPIRSEQLKEIVKRYL